MIIFARVMRTFPSKLQQKLENRKKNKSLRKLPVAGNNVDFASNDYLGFSRSNTILERTHAILAKYSGTYINGSSGSRLLSGNHELYEEIEKVLVKFHNADEALVFNSGYDANLGLFSSVPQRGDFIFYDEWIHASIRDGITMSNAKSYKFKHNIIEDLKIKVKKILDQQKNQRNSIEIYVVTESVFSMDGDTPDLRALVSFCKDYRCHLIIDEAHATGVFGLQGRGLVQQLQLEDQVFARVHTFGKAMGCHGAVIFGSKALKEYLINFARSFIYTTGLSPHAVATITSAYEELLNTKEIERLGRNIDFFRKEIERLGMGSQFIESYSAIQSCLILGAAKAKEGAMFLQQQGFDIKPILSPTVPEGSERLRFCIHSFNTEKEITDILERLATFVSK